MAAALLGAWLIVLKKSEEAVYERIERLERDISRLGDTQVPRREFDAMIAHNEKEHERTRQTVSALHEDIKANTALIVSLRDRIDDHLNQIRSMISNNHNK